jgi:hypothetical protein
VLLRDVVVALLAILLIVVAVIAVIAWRRRTARLAGRVPDVDIDEADELARAVESGRLALRELDDARAAIIACYVAMEQSLATAGAARGLAETPDELLARAAGSGLLPRTPAARLTALFYEARFSTHPLPASARDRAERALAEIAAELPVGEPS